SRKPPFRIDRKLAQNKSVPNDIEQILKVAVEHHQAGQFDAAAQGYEQILASDPNHGDALHLAGCLRYQKDDSDAGIALVRQAIALDPEHAEAHYIPCTALHAQWNLD